MRVLAIIPARYESSRFPGKPLATLGGESIISRVWRRVGRCHAVDTTLVATDDEGICDHVESFAGEGSVMLTFEEHRSGTDRCGEVMRRLENDGERFDIVLNVQGDEPFVEPSQLQTLVDAFKDPAVQIATLATRIKDNDELHSPNNVKVVFAADGKALYFSRQPIPFQRDVPEGQWLQKGVYYKHVGIYAFRPELLQTVCRLDTCTLEECERLEQLRWLHAGLPVNVLETPHANIGIDTPDDLAAAEEYMKQNNLR